MCGICGIVVNNHKDAVPDPDILQKMMQAMKHRGPDEEGHYADERAALGSCRLSIIDLKSGRQPISNEDGRLWIVFNGEIYNYQELRRYLLHRGHTFCSQSDTEVILHLYEEFQNDCVNYLNGIFAFAIWDRRAKELFAARDPMGIKPFYYTVTNGYFVFGSEMKVILQHPGVQRDIDLISLNEYLSYEYVPSPRTILRNIYRLEPGHTLRTGPKGLSIESYWNISLARGEDRPPVHWRDYAAGLDEILDNSIHKELVSDVPVGVLLSGGIDSSTITAYMARAYSGRVESFSIGFQEKSFDESGYAKRTAQALGTNHHELILTSKMASEMVPHITEVLDEPFGDSSFIPTYLLSKFASQTVKVVLGGDGGDELFAGYPTLIAHRLIEYYERIIPWLARSYLAPKIIDRMSVSFDNISLDFKIRRFFAGRGVPIQARHHRWLGAFMDEDKALLLQEWIRPILRDTYTQAYTFAAHCDARLPLNRILYDDMKMYLEGDILYKVDRASMAASLEVRVPLLNKDMLQFVNDLPLELKLHGLTGKYLLRKIMKRYLPKEVLKRPKKGFNMPVAQWLSGDLRELLLDMLSDAFIKRQGFFNDAYIQRLLSDHFDHRKDNRKLLWTLLMFQMWYCAYVETN